MRATLCSQDRRFHLSLSDKREYSILVLCSVDSRRARHLWCCSWRDEESRSALSSTQSKLENQYLIISLEIPLVPHLIKVWRILFHLNSPSLIRAEHLPTWCDHHNFRLPRPGHHPAHLDTSTNKTSFNLSKLGFNKIPVSCDLDIIETKFSQEEQSLVS